jgi:hypothetical protein
MAWIKWNYELLKHMAQAEFQITFEDKDVYRSKHETGLDTDWIHVEEDTVYWVAVVIMVMKIQLLY